MTFDLTFKGQLKAVSSYASCTGLLRGGSTLLLKGLNRRVYHRSTMNQVSNFNEIFDDASTRCQFIFVVNLVMQESVSG